MRTMLNTSSTTHAATKIMPLNRRLAAQSDRYVRGLVAVLSLLNYLNLSNSSFSARYLNDDCHTNKG